MITTPIGGVYFRVVDPDWIDPLDPQFASDSSGQRWNPPSVPCLYLNADVVTARANVSRRFDGLPYGPHDLDPATAPLLLGVEIPAGTATDAYTDDGLVAVGLPVTYPHDDNGDVIPHDVCQPIGRAVFEAGLDGVDCRSAAVGGDCELAWFPRSSITHGTSRQAFQTWW